MVNLSKPPAIMVDRSIVFGTTRVEKKPDNTFLNDWIVGAIAANEMMGVKVAASYWGIKR